MLERAAAMAALIVGKISKRKKKRQKPWLIRRNELGVDSSLLKELRIEEEEEYKTFLRVTPENLDNLLHLVQFDIQKQNTQFKSSYMDFSFFEERSETF